VLLLHFYTYHLWYLCCWYAGSSLEVKIETDSNDAVEIKTEDCDITECVHDDRPSIGQFVQSLNRINSFIIKLTNADQRPCILPQLFDLLHLIWSVTPACTSLHNADHWNSHGRSVEMHVFSVQVYRYMYSSFQKLDMYCHHFYRATWIVTKQ